MRSKIRIGFPLDETMRAEHRERVVRPNLEAYLDYDPTDSSDRGPHVDRVGLVAIDADFTPGEHDDPAPTRNAG
jgi:hypothetical protein